MAKRRKLYTAEAVEKILPEKLKIFRKNAGLTTNQVGKLIDRTPSAVTLWETGKSMPDVSTLLKLCDIYDISDLNEFLNIEIAPSVKTLARSEQEFIKLYRSCSASIKAAIKTILKQCNK